MEPKIEGDDPKPDELDAPKRDGEELASNGGVDDVPNIEGVADEVDLRIRVLGALNAPLNAKIGRLKHQMHYVCYQMLNLALNQRQKCL